MKVFFFYLENSGMDYQSLFQSLILFAIPLLFSLLLISDKRVKGITIYNYLFYDLGKKRFLYLFLCFIMLVCLLSNINSVLYYFVNCLALIIIIIAFLYKVFFLFSMEQSISKSYHKLFKRFQQLICKDDDVNINFVRDIILLGNDKDFILDLLSYIIENQKNSNLNISLLKSCILIYDNVSQNKEGCPYPESLFLNILYLIMKSNLKNKEDFLPKFVYYLILYKKEDYILKVIKNLNIEDKESCIILSFSFFITCLFFTIEMKDDLIIYLNSQLDKYAINERDYNKYEVAIKNFCSFIGADNNCNIDLDNIKYPTKTFEYRIAYEFNKDLYSLICSVGDETND